MSGLFDWLAGLFGGKQAETPEDVADRIDRVADRFDNAGNGAAAMAARAAADEARRAPTAEKARQVEAGFLRSRGLRPDGRPLGPARGRGPGDAGYVRYGTTLRSGGSRAWRYNNPGYVRCGPRSTYYGAIGCDGEFAIFPDHATGVMAMRQSLQDEYPGQPLRDALRQHLPPEAGADPDKICEQAGLDPEAKVEDLTGEAFGAIAPALESQSGWSEGEQFDRDAGDCPPWVDSAWDPPGADAESVEGADSDTPAPTDNS